MTATPDDGRHLVTVEWGGFSFLPRMTCHAPAESLCHADYECECEEYYGAAIEDGRPFHKTFDGERHDGRFDPEFCNLREWFDLDPAEMLVGSVTFPVMAEWTGDGYEFKITAMSAAAPGPAGPLVDESTLPDGISATFTHTCRDCSGTVQVVAGYAQAHKHATAPDEREVLDFLDEMNSGGHISYGDYSHLHALIAALAARPAPVVSGGAVGVVRDDLYLVLDASLHYSLDGDDGECMDDCSGCAAERISAALGITVADAPAADDEPCRCGPERCGGDAPAEPSRDCSVHGEAADDEGGRE